MILFHVSGSEGSGHKGCMYHLVPYCLTLIMPGTRYKFYICGTFSQVAICMKCLISLHIGSKSEEEKKQSLSPN